MRSKGLLIGLTALVLGLTACLYADTVKVTVESGTGTFTVTGERVAVPTAPATQPAPPVDPPTTMPVPPVVVVPPATQPVPVPPVPPVVTAKPALTGLLLVNTDTQKSLGAADGATVSTGVGLNLQAVEKDAKVKSVQFKLDGKLVRTENSSPFAMGGDDTGKYLPLSPALAAGSHTVVATPYDTANPTGGTPLGVAGSPLTATFIVQTASTPPPVEPPTDPTTPPDVPVSGNQPTKSTAGITPGTTLSSGTGVKLEAGKTYEGLKFTGSVKLNLAKGQSITLRNCLIDAGLGSYGVRCDTNAGTVNIERCEIRNLGSAGIYGQNFNAVNNYVHHSAGDAFKPKSNCLIQGNLVEYLGFNSPSAHADGVQIIHDSNVKIIGNYFHMPNTIANTKANAWLMISSDKGGITPTNVLFQGNWCEGGNYGINGDSQKSTCKATKNIIYRNSTKFGACSGAVTWANDNVDTTGKPMGEKDK